MGISVRTSKGESITVNYINKGVQEFVMTKKGAGYILYDVRGGKAVKLATSTNPVKLDAIAIKNL